MVAARYEAGSGIETASAETRFQESTIGAARNDIDDTADGIGAEQRRAGALDDLDTLNQFRRNVLNGCTAECPRVDANAVDENQRVIAFSASEEDRSGLAGTAIAPDIDAGLNAQQLGKVSDCSICVRPITVTGTMASDRETSVRVAVTTIVSSGGRSAAGAA